MRRVGIPAVFHRPVRPPALLPLDGFKPQNAVGGGAIHTKCQCFQPAGRQFTGRPPRHASCDSIVAKSGADPLSTLTVSHAAGTAWISQLPSFHAPFHKFTRDFRFSESLPSACRDPSAGRGVNSPPSAPALRNHPGTVLQTQPIPQPRKSAVLSKSKILPPGNRVAGSAPNAILQCIHVTCSHC